MEKFYLAGMYVPGVMKGFLLFLLLFFSRVLLAQHEKSPYVILISFDGFRYDYVSKFKPPHFSRFIEQGASAEAMIPSFPSKTFPNHYTLVTGLYPGNHGLVDNDFYDVTTKKRYEIRNQKAVADPVFYGGTPLWQLAQQQGMKSASFFWVGSEVAIQGRYPDYYVKYDDAFPNEKRIDQVVDWLKLPVADRPHFISLYFSLVDHVGHDTGPDSEELKRSVLTADSLVGGLMDKLKTVDLPVNVLIVSDHGMLNMKQEEATYVALSKLFNTKDSSVVVASGSTHTHLYTKKVDSLYRVLKEQEYHYKVYRRDQFPAAWHYNHERAGDLLIAADPGYYLHMSVRDFKARPAKHLLFGNHGFDPYVVKEMGAIFYAAGPNIQKGKRIPPFGNIHVYPLIARILNLSIPAIDGDIKVLESIYKK
jgi:predicted AlkP superfamily pyrophosphatase or phosphodiesterase